jgi:hypothetical protein
MLSADSRAARDVLVELFEIMSAPESGARARAQVC